MKQWFAVPAAMLLLTACTDSNDAGGSQTGARGISFSIDTQQDWNAEGQQARADLAASAPRNIKMQSSNGRQAWMQETTLTGIDERPAPTVTINADGETTAARSTGFRGDEGGNELTGELVQQASAMSRFSTFCNKTDGSTAYSNVACTNEGELEQPQEWNDDNQRSFYAVHPYASTGFTHNTSGLSYNFTVNSDVLQQQDLMYAATGSIAKPVNASVPLKFRHALTAVSFAFGSSVDFAQRVKSVTLNNVYTTGTYTLPASTASDSKGTWSNLGNKGNITLTFDTPVRASKNTAITDASQYFMMIPQTLDGASAVITFEDNSTLTANFSASASWREGTTKVYKLSSQAETWTYQLTVSNPADMTYTQTASDNYTIRSYRQNSTGTKQQAVPWEITKYEYSDDNGSTWTEAQPAWLTDLSVKNGLGSTSGTSGTATVDASSYIKDLSEARNNALKNAAAKSDYDLSQGKETANCYVISAPGTYKIPLVYGNARKADGSANTACFNTQPFVDYTGAVLTQMNIKDVTASTTAALVWKDVTTDIVTNLDVDEANNFLTFTVTKEALQQGNAVVGIKNGSDYLWSWHLWFAPESAMSTIAVTNYQNQVQYFTTENLGYVTDGGTGSSYQSPRKVRLTITQTYGDDPQTAELVITQNPGGTPSSCHDTKYQFGRKDAFSGVTTGAPTITTGKTTYTTAVKTPGTFYTYGSGNGDWCSTTYNNAWAVGNTGTSDSYATSSVVKSVYDPCPAGFKMPGSNAFTGFTSTGSNTSTASQFNVQGSFNKGWNFYTNSSKTATVFFPAAGSRYSSNGSLSSVGAGGYYWSAVPYSSSYGRFLYFYSGYVSPLSTYYYRAYGFSVRPVQEN